MLCANLSLVEIGPVVLEKMKIDRCTEDGQQAIRNAHLSFKHEPSETTAVAQWVRSLAPQAEGWGVRIPAATDLSCKSR